MKFSRWLYKNEDDTYDTVLEKVKSFKDWNEVIIDPITKKDLEFDIFQICEDTVHITNESKYKYSVFKFTYEHLVIDKISTLPFEDRVDKYESFIIIYEDNQNIYFSINRSGSFALTVLRKFYGLDLSHKKVIVEECFNTSNDFIDWLFYGDSSLEMIDEIKNLKIEKITGFKGNVSSKHSIVSQISGKGNEVMNALSTLAFMFENKEITYVRLIVKYLNAHELEFGLLLNGTIEFEIEKYQGSLFFGDMMDKYSKVLILISTHIFPIIKNKYIDLKDSDKWDTKVKIKKIEEIGALIQDQVSKKINSLKE